MQRPRGSIGRTGPWPNPAPSHARECMENDDLVILLQNYVDLEAMSFSFMHLLSENWHIMLCIGIKKMTWGSLLSSLTWCVTQYFVYLWENSFLQLRKDCARVKEAWGRRGPALLHPEVRALRKQNLAPGLRLTESIFHLCIKANGSLASSLPAYPQHQPEKYRP